MLSLGVGGEAFSLCHWPTGLGEIQEEPDGSVILCPDTATSSVRLHELSAHMGKVLRPLGPSPTSDPCPAFCPFPPNSASTVPSLRLPTGCSSVGCATARILVAHSPIHIPAEADSAQGPAEAVLSDMSFHQAGTVKLMSLPTVIA